MSEQQTLETTVTKPLRRGFIDSVSLRPAGRVWLPAKYQLLVVIIVLQNIDWNSFIAQNNQCNSIMHRLFLPSWTHKFWTPFKSVWTCRCSDVAAQFAANESLIVITPKHHHCKLISVKHLCYPWTPFKRRVIHFLATDECSSGSVTFHFNLMELCFGLFMDQSKVERFQSLTVCRLSQLSQQRIWKKHAAD